MGPFRLRPGDPYAIGLVIVYGWLGLGHAPRIDTGLAGLGLPWPLAYYCVVCVAAGMVAIVQWTVRKVRDRPPTVIRSDRVAIVDLRCGHGGVLTGFPGNQMLELEVLERGLEIARLDAALEGLSIVHLTDLHFTGTVKKNYFEEVVRRSNALSLDFIAVTGDILDNVGCLDWVPDTLGKLRARHGVYFVLGNHDMWNDPDRLRRVLVEYGLVDLAGRWKEIEIRGRSLILAGNEAPWGPAADLADAPSHDGAGPLRVVLAHSPDRLPWARANDVDLVLAGHNHGGQLRIPFIGPLVAPSRYGVRYASGTFHSPPTVMHVSRGISAKAPLRICCRPELAKLTLHAPEPPPRKEPAAAPRRRTEVSMP